MTGWALRVVLLGALLGMPPVAAQAQSAADQAVNAYRQKEAADIAADRDQRAAARQAALERNPGSPVEGNPAGDVTIVEFFDYACPYCKAVQPRLEAVVKADGHVRLVLKEFPILTPESMTATRMALAAMQQGKYEPFHLALMRAGQRLQTIDLDAVARASGLDVARLRRDRDAPAVTDEIIANFNLARGIRAFQTPTFVVNGHVLNEDSADIDFPKVIAAARAKPK